MKRKYILVTLLIIMLSFGGYLYKKLNKLKPQEKSFDLVLKNRKYFPDTINARLGDKITLNIDNQDNEVHGLNLPEFGVAESMPALQKSTFKFKATTTGELKTTCSSNHPEKINLIIEN